MVAAFRDPLLNFYLIGVSHDIIRFLMTLTVHDPVCTLVVEQPLNKDSTNELESHPAFYSNATQKYAETLLLGTQPMTYVLWKIQAVNDGAEQYCLSYVKTNMTVEHATFSYSNDWTMNSYHAAALSDLISQIMECRFNECKMLINPSHYRK